MDYIITKNRNYFEKIGEYNYCNLSVLKNLPDTIAIDTETTGLYVHEGHRIFCVQIGTGKDNYLIDMVDLSTPLFEKDRYTFQDLIPYIEDKILVGQNILFDLGMFYAEGFFPKPNKVRDTMLAYTLLNNGRIYNASFGTIMQDVLGVTYDKTEQKNISKVKLSQASTIQYSFQDVDRLLEAHDKMLVDLINNEQLDVYLLNCNFLRALAYYELCGMPIDKNLWAVKVENDLKEQKEKAQVVIDYIYDNLPKYRESQLSLFDTDRKKISVKLASVKQMIPVFKDLGINVVNDEGKETIDRNQINKSTHEFIDIWLDYQDINHDVSTYGENIFSKIVNGRLYTRYKVMVDTGRLATRADKAVGTTVGINFLNFPANEKTNRCFKAPEGSYIIGCDYASQESRCLAAISNDENSIINIEQDRDAHSLLARKVYPEIADLSDDEIKKGHKDKRQEGKVANFTISFGGNGYTIAKNLNKEPELGEKLYEGFKELYPGIFEWGETVFNQAARDGFIKSWGGFRLFLKDFYLFKHTEEQLKSITKEEWQQYRDGKQEYKKWLTTSQANKEAKEEILKKESSYANIYEFTKALNEVDENFPIHVITNTSSLKVYERYKGIVSDYYKRKSAYMRLCLNNPIQSRAAWQTKLASTMVFDEIQRNNDFWNVKLIVQIHDDIKMEANSLEKAKYYRTFLENAMRKAAETIVPHERVKFDADAFIGYDCWDVKSEYIFKEFLPKYEIIKEGKVSEVTLIPKRFHKTAKRMEKEIKEGTIKEKDLKYFKQAFGDNYIFNLPEGIILKRIS